MIVQRRIAPDYLRRPLGWFDLAILVLTFPYYLIPGVGSGTGFLVIARFARVIRVLVATAGLRRFAARLGKVAVVAAAVVVVGSAVAYRAEHPVNKLYATYGDSLWWAVVTLTTVGYGDIYPITTTGRFVAMGIMFTGVAVLGILGGLAGLAVRRVGAGGEVQPATEDEQTVDELRSELLALQADMRAADARVAALLARERAPPPATDRRGAAGRRWDAPAVPSGPCTAPASPSSPPCSCSRARGRQPPRSASASASRPSPRRALN